MIFTPSIKTMYGNHYQNKQFLIRCSNGNNHKQFKKLKHCTNMVILRVLFISAQIYESLTCNYLTKFNTTYPQLLRLKIFFY